MNTTTPTGDGVGALPLGLPDEAALTRLANEFFRGLPGQPPSAVIPVEPPPQPPPAAPAASDRRPFATVAHRSAGTRHQSARTAHHRAGMGRARLRGAGQQPGRGAVVLLHRRAGPGERARRSPPGTALDKEGTAVRAGHQCTQPILRRNGPESTVRPSLVMYNTCGEVDMAAGALHRLAADAGRHR